MNYYCKYNFKFLSITCLSGPKDDLFLYLLNLHITYLRKGNENMALKNLCPTLVVGVRIYKTAVDSVDSVFPVSGNRSIPTVNHVEHSNFVNRPQKWDRNIQVIPSSRWLQVCTTYLSRKIAKWLLGNYWNTTSYRSLINNANCNFGREFLITLDN